MNNYMPSGYAYKPVDEEKKGEALALLEDPALDHEKIVQFFQKLGHIKQHISITNYNMETKEIRLALTTDGPKTAGLKDTIMPYCVSIKQHPIYSMPIDKFIKDLVIPFGGKAFEHVNSEERVEGQRRRYRKPLTHEMIATIKDTIETFEMPLELVDTKMGDFFAKFLITADVPPLDPRLMDMLKKYAEPLPEGQAEPLPEGQMEADRLYYRIPSDDAPHIITLLDMMLDERLNGRPANKVDKVKIKYDLKPLLLPTKERDGPALTRISQLCREALLDIKEYEAGKGLSQHTPSPFHMVQRDVSVHSATLDKATDIGAVVSLPPDLRNALQPINNAIARVKFGRVIIDMRAHSDTLVDTLNEYVNKLPPKEAKALYETIKDSVSFAVDKKKTKGK